MDFKLRKFDMNMIHTRAAVDSHKSPIIVLIGKKDTGKSYMLKHILSILQDCLPTGLIIGGTEAANPFFQDFVPSKLIRDKYSPEIIEGVIKRQIKVKQQFTNDQRTSGHSQIDPRATLILDDCLYDKSWINEESTRYIFMNGRHIDLVTFITMQYPLGLPPSLRTQIDFVFILRDNIERNRKVIYESYAGMFPSYHIFCQFMDQCTEDYNCLVICNNVQSNKIEDQVFWYKAPGIPSFRMFNDSLWVDNKPFSTGLISEEYTPEAMRKSKGPWINVKKTN